MNNIPEGYDENGVRAGNGEWSKPVSQDYIDQKIMEATEYSKDEIELTEEGRAIRELIIGILEENGIEVV